MVPTLVLLSYTVTSVAEVLMLVTLMVVAPALTGPVTLAVGIWLQSPTVGPTADTQPSWPPTIWVAEMICPFTRALVGTVTVLVPLPAAVPIGAPAPLA